MLVGKYNLPDTCISVTSFSTSQVSTAMYGVNRCIKVPWPCVLLHIIILYIIYSPDSSFSSLSKLPLTVKI